MGRIEGNNHILSIDFKFGRLNSQRYLDSSSRKSGFTVDGMLRLSNRRTNIHPSCVCSP